MIALETTYLYCNNCIQSALGVFKDRLSKQRNIKRQQLQHPIVDMTKAEIEKKRLGNYVIMPEMVEIAFNKWWRSLESSTILQVRYPHERHGNAGNLLRQIYERTFLNLLMLIHSQMDDQQTLLAPQSIFFQNLLQFKCLKEL